MKNKFLGLIAIVSLTISGFSSQLFAESVEQFLTKQTHIRVNMSGGPNFGDQSNTFNVMNHLRELGFTGKFEIVYDNKIKDKMITLFDLPANFPAIYEDEKRYFTFIEAKSYFDRLKQGLVSLDDVVFEVGKGPNPLDSPAEANSKAEISFSSYFDPRGEMHNKTNISLLRDKNYADHQQNSGNKFFIFPVPTYEQAHDYLFNNPMGQTILAKKPGFIPFLNGLDGKKFNVMFVYGRTLRFTNKNDELYGSPSPSNILQVIAGVRYAQLHGGEQFNKPLIIAIFYDYQALSNQLLDLLKQDQWGDYEQPDADIARQALRELKISSALSTADLNDAASIDQINNLQPGQILLLSMGPLPKIVFDGLYNHTASNIWPQVYEGAATFSALNFTGRPRFECADTPFLHGGDNRNAPSWTLGFDQIQNGELKQRMQSFYSLTQGFCGSTRIESNDNFIAPWKARTHEALGRFIIEAMDEHSAFSEYFSDVKKYVLNPESDRIRYALEEIIAQLDR
jgi:hypothetical protein